jgi:hypothetical protein
MSLSAASQNLNSRIVAYREMVLEGTRKAEEDARTKAKEKRQEAKYTKDPALRRAAILEAEEYEEEAKKRAPKPEKGLKTTQYWEAEIEDRRRAAALPESLVEVTVNQKGFEDWVKQRQISGEKIHAHLLPGLRLTLKTKVGYYK